ncbi:MAG: cytochrome c-type biogenesis protein [Maricaulaceae bacterium]
MIRTLLILTLGLLCAGMSPAQAPAPAPPAVLEARLEDPALEARAQALFRELRCPVCTAQSIAESDADVSADLRRLVRGFIQEGRSDREILADLTARYGDTVRLRPPVDGRTYLLWATPWLVLGLGVALWWRAGRARPSEAAPAL